MIGTAQLGFDRDYFELHYDDWLWHRSRFKRYENWFATALTLSGLTVAFAFKQGRLVGIMFTIAGIYEFIMSVTHKRRWVGCGRFDLCTRGND